MSFIKLINLLKALQEKYPWFCVHEPEPEDTASVNTAKSETLTVAST